MSFLVAGVKLTAVAGVVLVALVLGSGEAVATFTRYFCAAAVGVFVIASTVGLASRLRT